MTTDAAFDAVDGLRALREQTLGNPEICVAVLDGPVDQTHPCFEGANLRRVSTLAGEAETAGAMTAHGTHVASVIFGQPGGPVEGVSPACRGLIIPVFRDGSSGRVAQLDLARAINQAIQEGAHVINISGGERTETGASDPLLARAIRSCDELGILIVAAVGNDACECLNVPAAVPSVLAVGALGSSGQPLALSNWNERYLSNGILAPGENIVGASPGGGTALRTGTSFATPIVAGIAGLLLSLQLKTGQRPRPRAVAEAILAAARPCDRTATPDPRCLAGILNVPGAQAMIVQAHANGDKMTVPDVETAPSTLTVSAGAPGHAPGLDQADVTTSVASPDFAGLTSSAGPVGAQIKSLLAQTVPGELLSAPDPASTPQATAIPRPAPSTGLAPADGCSCENETDSYLFAIGAIGYDFGTEARRDSFRQLMPTAHDRAANPHSADQIVAYLQEHPSESTKLVWTLNLDLTPIYALEAELPYAGEVYEFLRTALRGQIENEDSPEHIARVSVPARLTGRTRRLFSGQVVPVAVVQRRGLWAWNVNALLDDVTGRFDPEQREIVRGALRNFLDKVYYELRNLGQTSPDRALNYSATNAFQASEAMSRALYPRDLLAGAGLYMLDHIDVSKSPFCRMDSDCWDVKLTFFDPDNDRRARIVMRFTVDVSDEMPVTLGPVRHWTAAGC
jgi:cyanobactin maturation PatA/PatG family protease